MADPASQDTFSADVAPLDPASLKQPSASEDDRGNNNPAEQSVLDVADEGSSTVVESSHENIPLTAEEAARAIDEEASKGIAKVVSWGAIANEEDGRVPTVEGETIDGNELVSTDEGRIPGTEAMMVTSDLDPGVALMANMNEPNLSGTELSAQAAAALNNEVMLTIMERQMRSFTINYI